MVRGDFNFEPQSREFQKVTRLGLMATHALSHHQGELFTLDPIANNLIYGGELATLVEEFRQAVERRSAHE